MSHHNVPPELQNVPVVEKITELAIMESKPGGLFMEFGVATGYSLRRIRKLLDLETKLYGFDSFKGLPEAWNGLPARTFMTDYRIALPNTELVVGNFSDTLPPFLETHPEPISFVHVDCDLYSSTKTVLDTLKPRLCSGSIILFDELFGYSGYEAHEWRALQESGIQREWIGRWNSLRAVMRMT